MVGSIICGVDGSESARGAARVARALSIQLGLRLVFVRVVEPGSAREKVSAIAKWLSAYAIAVDGSASWHVDVGHPADRLVVAAAKEEASLIVVGSTGPRSSLLGSISAEVSRRAPCPVVVVPPGADKAPMEPRRPRREPFRRQTRSLRPCVEGQRSGTDDRRAMRTLLRPASFTSAVVSMAAEFSRLATPYEPLMRWENEGGALAPASEAADLTDWAGPTGSSRHR
jgi:nucleotide-binding universal stress UspA family protein